MTVRVNDAMSPSLEVTSGVPQGSVLGPILFLVYINDMVSNIGNAMVKIFADDCKLYFKCRLLEDYSVLLHAVHCVFGWASSNQLKLSLEKCMVLHLASVGQINPGRSYLVNGIALPSVSYARDLGILFTPDLKFGDHCRVVAAKAAQRSNLIFRAFVCRDANFLISMFKTYVRPLLEYCTPVWSPHLLKDICVIERVQRRFTKRIPGFRNVPYKSRLEILGLQSLEERRLVYDLVECFNIVYSLNSLRFHDFFVVRNGVYNTRGHSKRLFVLHSRIDCRKYFFSNRVVPVWNSLPDCVVTSSSVDVFKRRLEGVDLEGFLRYNSGYS
jgi:hypothetical protein